MKTPKAALIYYDNYELIGGLSDEQLGVLFRAVMEYGKALLRGETVSIEAFRRGYPDMTDGTYGFFAFMADNVRRDVATYHEKSANYSAAAQRREAEKARAREERPSAPSASGSYASRRPAPRPEQDDISPYVRQFDARKRREALQRQEWS